MFEGIALRPQHYDIEMPQKGVRSDMVYTIYADLFNEATTDNNGAYLNSWSNKKQYFIASYHHKNCPPNTWWKALLQCQKWQCSRNPTVSWFEKGRPKSVYPTSQKAMNKKDLYWLKDTLYSTYTIKYLMSQVVR